MLGRIIRDFIHGLSGSPYYKTNASYGTPTGLINMGGEYTDAYSQGTSLTDAKVRTVVTNALSGNHLARDTTGVYFVLTSTDVTETSGFCTRYCGWHTYSTILGLNIKYSFVGNANPIHRAQDDRLPGAAQDQPARAQAEVPRIGHRVVSQVAPDRWSGIHVEGGDPQGSHCSRGR